MSARRERNRSIDPLDSTVRIRFSEGTLPLHRLDSVAVDNNTFERDDEAITPDFHSNVRQRAYSISQNVDLKEALTEPGREPGVDVNELELDM